MPVAAWAISRANSASACCSGCRTAIFYHHFAAVMALGVGAAVASLPSNFDIHLGVGRPALLAEQFRGLVDDRLRPLGLITASILAIRHWRCSENHRGRWR